MRFTAFLVATALAACGGGSEGTPDGRIVAADAPLPDARPPDAAPPPPDANPASIRFAGLYSDFAARTVDPRLRAYEPRYTLWADGLVKRRFLDLPAGAKIDTSDMDHWDFPVGTR